MNVERRKIKPWVKLSLSPILKTPESLKNGFFLLIHGNIASLTRQVSQIRKTLSIANPLEV